jgi:hypothetical protein
MLTLFQVQDKMANSILQDLDDEVPVLKFGDASVAAAFTSKLRHVKSGMFYCQ